MTSYPAFQTAVEQWHEARAAYEDALEAQIAAADAACRGVLFNARGRRAGLSEHRLFLSNATFAHAYASEELIEWWRIHGRLTFAAFERQYHDLVQSHEWGA